MAGVEIRHLSKRFGGLHAVDDVDLSIREGEFLVLLGPSGCGKTTLLRMIAGLERPTAGEIHIGGERMDDVPPRARGIAMVFQSYAPYPHRTVSGNISFPLEALGLARAAIDEKVRWAADMFGIGRYLDRYPRQLSGGERQRVALCRALVRDPKVFLLDEPLANLDAKLRNTARDELKRFQRQIKRTTVYVTHDQVEAMGLGDRIAVMDRGKVRQDAPGLPARAPAAERPLWRPGATSPDSAHRAAGGVPGLGSVCLRDRGVCPRGDRDRQAARERRTGNSGRRRRAARFRGARAGPLLFRCRDGG